MADLKFSESQIKTATAIFNCVYTPFPVEYTKAVLEVVQQSASPKSVNGLSFILSTLGTKPGMLLLTGYYDKSSFDQLTLDEGEKVLLSWKKSRLPLLRGLVRTFSSLVNGYIYTTVPDAISLIGYPFHSSNPSYRPSQLTQPPSPAFAFNFISSAASPLVTDVLVIGTGCGGGVAGARLASLGHKVLFVEKGTYVPHTSPVSCEREGLDNLFEARGILASSDSSISVIAGSTFGGGSTVNWSGALTPPRWLREEWKNKAGVEWCTSEAFQKSVEFVSERVGIESAVEHNKSNEMLFQGGKKAGFDVSVLPQNSGGKTHNCGQCTFGCPSGVKNGMVNTFLQDANHHGASFLLSHTVERILFSKPSNTTYPPTHGNLTDQDLSKFTYSTWGGRTKAVGALLVDSQGTRKVVVAKKGVVVAGGTIHSPVILLKSGIKNEWIGKNLRLHPSLNIIGYYDEEIRPWEGDIMTAHITENSNRDGTHYGSKIIVVQSSLYIHTGILGWQGREDFHQRMLEYKNSLTLCAITRDRDSGTVTVGSHGKPVIDYTISSYDSASALQGLLGTVAIHFCLGARRIKTPQLWVDDFVRDPSWSVEESEKEFEKWKEIIKKAGLEGPLGSAHQMGTCKMGRTPKESATDVKGRVWGTKGLWVADTSLFPSSSGVNPMITCESVAHFVAGFIDDDIKKEEMVKSAL